MKRMLISTPAGAHFVLAHQKRTLEKRFPDGISNLIVFLTPGVDTINGGILSICSVYIESLNLKEVHRSEVLLCTPPGDPPLPKYTRFSNSIDLFSFILVLSHFKNLDRLLINIPENRVVQFLEYMTEDDCSKLRNIENLHLNMMLQNIKELPDSYPNRIETLKELGTVTCTTAHQQYTNKGTRAMLGVPLHKLSTYVSPEQYQRRSYREKRNLLVVSPDPNPLKEMVLERIGRELPEIQVRVIRNLTYEEYKQKIAEAKWSITFGEGLDNYFIETIFSGGIGFAVFNKDFFTPDFKSMKSIYGSINELIQRICHDIACLDNEDTFSQYQTEQYEICSRHYNSAVYRDNLKSFYEGKYTIK